VHAVVASSAAEATSVEGVGTEWAMEKNVVEFHSTLTLISHLRGKFISSVTIPSHSISAMPPRRICIRASEISSLCNRAFFVTEHDAILSLMARHGYDTPEIAKEKEAKRIRLDAAASVYPDVIKTATVAVRSDDALRCFPTERSVDSTMNKVKVGRLAAAMVAKDAVDKLDKEEKEARDEAARAAVDKQRAVDAASNKSGSVDVCLNQQVITASAAAAVAAAAADKASRDRVEMHKVASAAICAADTACKWPEAKNVVTELRNQTNCAFGISREAVDTRQHEQNTGRELEKQVDFYETFKSRSGVEYAISGRADGVNSSGVVQRPGDVPKRSLIPWHVHPHSAARDVAGHDALMLRRERLCVDGGDVGSGLGSWCERSGCVLHLLSVHHVRAAAVAVPQSPTLVLYLMLIPSQMQHHALHSRHGGRSAAVVLARAFSPRRRAPAPRAIVPVLVLTYSGVDDCCVCFGSSCNRWFLLTSSTMAPVTNARSDRRMPHPRVWVEQPFHPMAPQAVLCSGHGGRHSSIHYH
jgi:hypothetical protein